MPLPRVWRRSRALWACGSTQTAGAWRGCADGFHGPRVAFPCYLLDVDTVNATTGHTVLHGTKIEDSSLSASKNWEEQMHPNEICTPTEILWQPVTVNLRGGIQKKVCGPLQGFEILNRHIVGPQSHITANAARCCRLAVERKISPEQARQAFIAATMDQELRAK